MNLTIDIHGFTVEEAKREIERTIAKAPKGTTEIIVIHGYHSGSKLKDLLSNPNGIRSKRIKRRKYSMNQGQTIIELYSD
jgi:hypothetical protein